MNKHGIERVVLALDPGSESRTAIATGAALAAALKVPLHCVFVEDEGLIGFADLALARHFDLSGLGAGRLDRELIEASFRVQARRIEAEIRETTVKYGVKSSFASVRGPLSLASLDIGRGDFLVLEGGARPVTGLARLGSRWTASACAAEISVLVLRGRLGARAIVGKEGGGGMQGMFADLMAALTDLHVDLIPAEIESKFRQAEQQMDALACDMVVLEESRVGSEFVAAMLTQARCSVLVLRGSSTPGT